MTEPIFDDTTELVYSRLPGHFRAADPATNWTTKRYLSGWCAALDEVQKLINRFEYIPPEDGPGHRTSDLVDPLTADAKWLPWLAQMVGMRILGEPETFRNEIARGAGGFNAGTTAAIIAAAQTVLVGDRYVGVYPRMIDNATPGNEWDMLLVTRSSETLKNLMPEWQATGVQPSLFSTDRSVGSDVILRTNLNPNPEPETATGWSGPSPTIQPAPWDPTRNAYRIKTSGTTTAFAFPPPGVHALIPAGTKVSARAKVMIETARTNWVANPILESGSAYWSVNGSTGTRVLDSDKYWYSVPGPFTYIAANNTLAGELAQGLVGAFYGAKVTLKAGSAGAVGKQVRIQAHNNTNALGNGSTIVTLTLAPQTIDNPAATAATVNTNPFLIIYPVGTWTASDTVMVTEAMVEQVSGVGVSPGSFFHGNMVEDDDYRYEWNNGAGVSRSRKYTKKPNAYAIGRFRQNSPANYLSVDSNPVNFLTGWKELIRSQVLAADCVANQLHFVSLPSASNGTAGALSVPEGSYLYMGDAIWEIGDGGPYFDGGSAADGDQLSRWSGAANASTSQKYIAGTLPVVDLELAPHDDFYAKRALKITFTDFDPGATFTLSNASSWPVSQNDPINYLFSMAADTDEPVDFTITIRFYNNAGVEVGTPIVEVFADQDLNPRIEAAVDGTTPNTATTARAFIAFNGDLPSNKIIYFGQQGARLESDPTWVPKTADPAQAVIDRGAKPAGVLLHNQTFSTTWADFEATFPTWAVIEANNPWSNLEEAGF